VLTRVISAGTPGQQIEHQLDVVSEDCGMPGGTASLRAPPVARWGLLLTDGRSPVTFFGEAVEARTVRNADFSPSVAILPLIESRMLWLRSRRASAAPVSRCRMRRHDLGGAPSATGRRRRRPSDRVRIDAAVASRSCSSPSRDLRPRSRRRQEPFRGPIICAMIWSIGGRRERRRRRFSSAFRARNAAATQWSRRFAGGGSDRGGMQTGER